jgi:predicted outer membrane repeat protein
MFTIRENASLEIRRSRLFSFNSIVGMNSSAKFAVRECLVSNRLNALIILPSEFSIGTIGLYDSVFYQFDTIWRVDRKYFGEKDIVITDNCVFQEYSNIAFLMSGNQSIRFSNSVFQNARSQAFRISNEMQRASFMNCTFTNISSGAWIASGGYVSCEYCTFRFSSAPQIIFASLGQFNLKILIKFSTFSYNSASLLDGFDSINSHSIIFQETVFTSNTVPYGSSGIIFRNPPRVSEFQWCSFLNNSPNSSLLFSFDLIAFPIIFIISSSIIDDSGVASFKANLHINSVIQITNNSFRNIIVSSDSGVLSFRNVLLPFQIMNCTFENINSGRSASDYFSTIYLSGVRSINITRCVFKNIAGYLGPTLMVTGSALLVTSCIMTNITSIYDNAGIYSINSRISIELCQFSFLAARAGAVLYIGNLGTVNFTRSVISNCVSYETLAVVYGGPGSILYIDDVIFSYVQSIRGACAIRTTSSILFLSNVIIENCTSYGVLLIFWFSNTHNLYNLTIRNSTSLNAAFISIADTPLTISYMTIENSFFLSGSGVVVTDTGSGIFNLTILNSTFKENKAFKKKFGFASMIALQACLQCIFINCTFISNSAFTGGAIYVKRANYLSISKSRFLQNGAFKGGALYFYNYSAQNFKVENSIFMGNRAIMRSDVSNDCLSAYGSGGAIHFEHFQSDSINNSFKNCVFINNYAEFFGGIFSIENVGVDEYSIETFVNISKNSYGNEAQFYGNISGSVWRSYEVELGTHSMQLSENFHVFVNFIDRFGQRAFGFLCYSEIQIDYSSPDDFFVVDPPYILGSFGADKNYLYAGKVSFFQPLNPFPLINETILIYLNFKIVDSMQRDLQKIGSMQLQLCESGSILVSDPYLYYKCQACRSGSFVDFVEELFVCRFCSLGKYSEARATTCSDCESGKIANEIASGSCIQCVPGYFSESRGYTSCMSCSSGKFTNLSGSSMCYNCPVGSSTIQDGARSIFDCVCPSGKFGSPWNVDDALDSSMVCQECIVNDGLECKDNSTIPFIFPGFYRDQKWNIAKVCFPLESCKETGFRISTICGSGYDGRLCGNCITGLSYRSFGTCRFCSSPSWILFALLIFVLLVLSFLAYSMFQTRTISRIDIRIMVLWIQFFAVFARLESTLPKPLQDFLQIFSVFNLNFDILSLRKILIYIVC